MMGVPGMAARILTATARRGVNVAMISLSSSEQSISYIIRMEDVPAVMDTLHREFEEELARRDIDRIWSDDDVAIVAVIGPGVPRNPHIAARVFDALGSNSIQINSLSLGSSMNGFSIVVDREYADCATQYIHRELGLGSIQRSEVRK